MQQFIKLILFVFIGSWCQANDLKIAIIDTGIDLSNNSLGQKLWINPLEIPGNGKDDDRNGFVDDIHGWSFADDSSNIGDNEGHGTHIASIIAPAAPDRSLIIIKYYNSRMSPEKNFKNFLKAFQYALSLNVQIINFSGGGYGQSADERKLMADAEKKGILIISAAGNDHKNNDISPFYPASYPFKNILSVGSHDQFQRPSWFSNYGQQSIDLFANGEDVKAMGLKGKPLKLSGTSQATALISQGMIALLKQKSNFRQHPALLVDRLLISRTSKKIVDWHQLQKLADENQTALGEEIEEGMPINLQNVEVTNWSRSLAAKKL